MANKDPRDLALTSLFSDTCLQGKVTRSQLAIRRKYARAKCQNKVG